MKVAGQLQAHLARPPNSPSDHWSLSLGLQPHRPGLTQAGWSGSLGGDGVALQGGVGPQAQGQGHRPRGTGLAATGDCLEAVTAPQDKSPLPMSFETSGWVVSSVTQA